MNIKTNKEKLAKVINTRFQRIANYLKKQTKTKTIKENHFNVCMTYNLHQIVLTKTFDELTTKYILDYLESNYITKYIELVENDISLQEIKNIIKTLNKYNNEDSINNLEEQELINILKEYIDISNLVSIKESIIKTYNTIKSQYQYIELD